MKVDDFFHDKMKHLFFVEKSKRGVSHCVEIWVTDLKSAACAG